MDILKRNVAPLAKETWDEIDETAKDVITNIIAGRKVVSVEGPKGWDYTSVDIGRLKDQEEKSVKLGEVRASTYEVKELTEARVSFELSKWELDNVLRGAKDVELDALEEACKELALFEERAIFNGYVDGDIEGLTQVAAKTMSLGSSGDSIVKAIGEAVYTLMEAHVAKPYDLVVSPEIYDVINIISEGAYLPKIIESIIGGMIIRSKVIDGAVLLPHKDEDFELTIGQDFSVGYESETEDTVRLFVTESFTFRVLDEGKVVHFTI